MSSRNKSQFFEYFSFLFFPLPLACLEHRKQKLSSKYTTICFMMWLIVTLFVGFGRHINVGADYKTSFGKYSGNAAISKSIESIASTHTAVGYHIFGGIGRTRWGRRQLYIHCGQSFSIKYTGKDSGSNRHRSIFMKYYTWSILRLPTLTFISFCGFRLLCLAVVWCITYYLLVE